jgi:hypothetical protein
VQPPLRSAGAPPVTVEAMPDSQRPFPLPDHRAALRLLLLAAAAGVAALTLTPTGTGWAWGSPVVELRWYVTGLGSGATLLQLVGNLGLLVVPAALAVLLWPSLGRLARLGALALAVGGGIELLQWALPLGRVVSPLDAVLNAVGALLAGMAAGHVARSARRTIGRSSSTMVRSGLTG